MRIKEFTGKTTQEAIDNGLAELGVTSADVHVDVLQEGAKGLFGLFGSKPACVRLTVMEDEREDDHGLSDLLGSFSLNEQKKKSAPKSAAPKAEAPKPEAKPDAPKAEAKPEMKPEKKPEKKPEPKPAAPKAEVKLEAPKAETKPEKKPEAPKPPRERKPRPARPARAESEKRDFAPMVPADRAARHPSGGHPGGTRAEIPDGRDRPHGRQGGRLCGRQQGG